MPWARFDDRFPSNRKVRLLSDGAFRLYVSAICWSAENLTDGVIKTAELRLVADVRATRTRAKELVDAELFEVLEGVGWKIHDYHDYNPTAEQVRADREQRTARQQRWRKKKQGGTPDPEPPNGSPDVDASTDASRDASRNGVGDAAPSRPVPTRTPSMADVGGDSAGSEAPDLDHLAPAPIEIDGFQLTDAMRRWAHATHPGVDIDHSTAQFVSHYRSTGARRKSWPDAWQKWIRDDARRTTQRASPTQGAFLVALDGNGHTPPPRRSTTDDRVAAALQLAAELRAEEGHTA
ncbi:hypothetical protein [Streptomyces cupreus]|uniref:Uncharacterized protein n=1 Tax=Streptomyces cupreus TaxID=2759956 RepID=A0A7X1M9K5_9ACTN|nr:hypothetical protein [Streptomyces cupreus]MBC2903187.1 hypothetical protein [Streptomyces cupreus]